MVYRKPRGYTSQDTFPTLTLLLFCVRLWSQKSRDHSRLYIHGEFHINPKIPVQHLRKRQLGECTRLIFPFAYDPDLFQSGDLILIWKKISLSGALIFCCRFYKRVYSTLVVAKLPSSALSRRLPHIQPERQWEVLDSLHFLFLKKPFPIHFQSVPSCKIWRIFKFPKLKKKTTRTFPDF